MNQTAPAKSLPSKAGRGPSPSPLREVSGIKLYHSLTEDLSVYQAANFGERLFATFIDSFVIGIVITLLKLPFVRILAQLELTEQSGRSLAINIFLSALAYVIYHIIPQALWGQTLGKNFIGIRVVPIDDCAKLTGFQIAKREVVGKSLSFALCGIGFLMMLWRQDKRTLHDLLAATKVVKVKKPS